MGLVGGVRLQFHAEPRELLGLAEDWAVRDELYVVLERFFPDDYVAAVVERTELRDEAATDGGR